MFTELHDVEGLLPEGESCDEASDEEWDEENASNVLVETRPLRMDIIWQNGVQAESLRPLNFSVQYIKEVKGRVDQRRPKRPELILVSVAWSNWIGR